MVRAPGSSPLLESRSSTRLDTSPAEVSCCRCEKGLRMVTQMPAGTLPSDNEVAAAARERGWRTVVCISGRVQFTCPRCQPAVLKELPV